MSHWEFESTRSRMWPATCIGSDTCWTGWKTGASASIERHHLGLPRLGGRWNHPWWWCRLFCLSLSPGNQTAHRRTNLSWDHFSCLVEDDTVPQLSCIFVWTRVLPWCIRRTWKGLRISPDSLSSLIGEAVLPHLLCQWFELCGSACTLEESGDAWWSCPCRPQTARFQWCQRRQVCGHRHDQQWTIPCLVLT